MSEHVLIKLASCLWWGVAAPSACPRDCAEATPELLIEVADTATTGWRCAALHVRWVRERQTQRRDKGCLGLGRRSMRQQGLAAAIVDRV